jgi:hypothetical protein
MLLRFIEDFGVGEHLIEMAENIQLSFEQMVLTVGALETVVREVGMKKEWRAVLERIAEEEQDE